MGRQNNYFLQFGKRQFNDLKHSLQGISPNILSERLQFLEKEGIVHSKLYSSHPPRYEYLLTGRGQELRHVLNAMAIWGNRFLEPKYTKLIHAECGYEVEPAYYCPHCESYVKNIAYDSDHTSE